MAKANTSQGLNQDKPSQTIVKPSLPKAKSKTSQTKAKGKPRKEKA